MSSRTLSPNSVNSRIAAGFSASACISLMSAPAMNAFPSPVKMTTRTARFARTSASASFNSCITLLLSAFKASGRLIVMYAIAPSMDKRTSRRVQGSPLAACFLSRSGMKPGCLSSMGFINPKARSNPRSFMIANGPFSQRKPVVAPRSTSSTVATPSATTFAATPHTTASKRSATACLRL